jgi:hypothetical protein
VNLQNITLNFCTPIEEEEQLKSSSYDSPHESTHLCLLVLPNLAITLRCNSGWDEPSRLLPSIQPTFISFSFILVAASHLASLPATVQHTFGLKRSESLAALFSMVSLVIVSFGLAYAAIRRLIDPPETGVDGFTMTIIAGIGVIVNVVLAWVLGK